MTKGTIHKKYIACSLSWREGLGVKPAWFLLLVLALSFLASCEEVEEASEYDNWQVRNEVYIDSLKQETGEIYVATEEQAQLVEPGQLFAIRNVYASTNEKSQYIYCKKLVAADKTAERPLYTGSVTAYYYGTLINGESFDGNFTGYGALDQSIPLPPEKVPNDFESPSDFEVSGNIISGWTTVLQYMRKGERWMIYIPWASAYGSDGSSSGGIPGYSTLIFDILLTDVVN